MAFSEDLISLSSVSEYLVGFSCLQNKNDEDKLWSIMINLSKVKRLSCFLSLYAGGAFGLRFDASNSEDGFSQKSSAILSFTKYFALKADAGVMLNLSRVFTKFEVAYYNVLGFTLGAGIGIGLDP
ncbi:MAG: hypothetical protein HUK25_04595 [Treponema sp.]|nr:hypothetical protein [Treponema sp.]